jgi:CheY-like chemotaxis protein
MTIAEKRKTILLVEGVEPLSEVIKTHLEHNIFSILIARSVKEALPYLEEGGSIDCILLTDEIMAEGGGIELIKKVKQSGTPWRAIPIFVIALNLKPGDEEVYMREGVHGCYAKGRESFEYIIESIIRAVNNY